LILHPSQEVTLSPLRQVIGLGLVAEASGVSVELLSIEVRDAGALIYLRARPVDEVIFMTAAVSVTDDAATPYRTFDAGSEGSPVHCAGQCVVMPAPARCSRLWIDVLNFGWPRDYSEERRGAGVIGPWSFETVLVG
jgi:hypothetical protein